FLRPCPSSVPGRRSPSTGPAGPQHPAERLPRVRAERAALIEPETRPPNRGDERVVRSICPRQREPEKTEKRTSGSIGIRWFLPGLRPGRKAAGSLSEQILQGPPVGHGLGL